MIHTGKITKGRRFLPRLFGLLGLGLLFQTCGIQMVPLTLEDPREKYQGADPFKTFTATKIYGNTTGDEVWGIEEVDCKKSSFSNSAYGGDKAIQLDWNKTTCDWLGIGIGWDGWAPKDLSEIMDVGAIQFYVRAIKDETHVPLMVFLLEDYAEKRTATVFRAKHLMAYPINEEWKQVQIPLSAFPHKKDGVDLTNIKQLVIELQGAGQVIIDEMEIVRYKERPSLESTSKPSITPLGQLPLSLYHDEFTNSWGLEKNDCRDFNYTTAEKKAGNKSLSLSWNEPYCDWMPFGFSWNSWLGVDLGQYAETAKLECYVKVVEGNSSGLELGFQDYFGNKAMVKLEQRYFGDGAPGDWRRVEIPLKEFRFSDRQVKTENIKMFYVDAHGSGKLYIDEISLIK